MAKNKSAISNKIKHSRGENVFNVFNILIMVFMILICAYPFWYVICASFSNASQFVIHKGMLWLPLGFDLKAYEKVLTNNLVWIGYANTIFYVVVGTAINIVMTVLCAYFLSRREVPGKKFVMILVVFTMYFLVV